MTSYQDLKARQQKEMNEFPLEAAFSKEQFANMMAKWGLTENDTDKIYSIDGGCFIRRSDSTAFHELIEKQAKEREDAIMSDTTGEGYIYEMFSVELANHEYGYTRDVEETFDALGFTLELINSDQRLVRGLYKAIKEYKDD